MAVAEEVSEVARSVPVVVDDVARSFGRTQALAGVSLEVRRGEMFGVIGPDGAGKTTLLRIVCGLLAPGSGHVRVFGADPFRVRNTATASVGYLSQRFSLYGDLSIDENVEFFARLHGVNDYAARRTRLLELTGLERFRGRLADRLSGGMKQKLALACTLVHEPSLLVLDEPTTGVDPVSRREFWKLLAEFLAQGLTILLATPYLDEAERCSRVALLSEGRVLALEEPGRLRQRLPGVMLEIVTTDARRALDLLSELLGTDRVQLFGDRLHARADSRDAVAMIASQLEKAGIKDAVIRTVMPGLEDVFIDLLGRPGAACANGAPSRSTSLEGTV